MCFYSLPLACMTMEIISKCNRYHINRLKDDRWTSRVTTWRPYDKKIRQGRPAKRWRDDLDKYWSDTIWQRTAQDRVIWRLMLRPSPNHGTQRLPNDDDDESLWNVDPPLKFTSGSCLRHPLYLRTVSYNVYVAYLQDILLTRKQK